VSYGFVLLILLILLLFGSVL
jgi:hypothetical protein